MTYNPDPPCGAKTRAGTPCRRPAGWGTTHPGTGQCKLHFGCTPNAIIHAERVAAEQKIATIRNRFPSVQGEPIGVTLQTEIDRTREAIAFCETMLDQIDDKGLVFGVTRLTSKAGQVEKTVEARTNIWWRMWRDERAHLARLLKDAADIGIRVAEHELSRTTMERVIAAVRRSIAAGGGDVAAGEAVLAAEFARLDAGDRL